jgi:thiamine kinase-like enzyme
LDASDRTPVDLAERAEIEGVLAEWDRSVVVGSIGRLSGLTNRIFQVRAGEGTVAVRLPGLGTDAYIDRRAELHNARLMSMLGIGATILYSVDGALVTTFLAGRVLSPEILRDERDALDRVARLLRQVHDSTRPFASVFDPATIIAGHRAGLADVPPGTDALIARLGRHAPPAHLVPCHHDPWPENFIDTAPGLRLLDWEYSAMGDPAWDLADVVVEADLGPEAIDRFLASYSGGAVDPALPGRVARLAPVTDLLWGLWALVQHRDGNDAMDYATYGRHRIGRAARAR